MSTYFTVPDDVGSGNRGRSSKINEIIQSTEDAFDNLPAGLVATTAEIVAARDGDADLLTQIQRAQATTTEVVAARDGEASLLATINRLDDSIISVSGASGCLVSVNDSVAGFLNGKIVVTGSATNAKTANYAVTAADLRNVLVVENNDGSNESLSIITDRSFTNAGATIDIVYTLPAGTEGDKLRVRVLANYYLRLNADGTETFRYLAQQSAAGGYIRSNVIGTSFTIEFLGSEWLITSLEGILNYDV